MEITRPTILEVDTNAFNYNVKQVQDFIGDDKKIMPVIKANGYGTYINKLNNLLEQFDIVSVATVDEALEIRQNGYNKEIFVLNQPYISEIDKIIENDITVAVSNTDFIIALGNTNKNVKVHIEVETGMGRTGVELEEINSFIDLIESYKNIEIEGIYTHFSSADYDDEYTRSQYELFEKAVKILENKIGKIKYIHCSASSGILKYPDLKCNLVRPGIILYGYNSFDKVADIIDLKPICKLKSKITFLKEVPENTSISY